jgi:hypothetical protein
VDAGGLRKMRIPERSRLRLRLVITFLKKQETELNKEMAISPEVYNGLVEMLTFVEEDYEELLHLAKKRHQICPLPVMLDPQEVTPKILRGM